MALHCAKRTTAAAAIENVAAGAYEVPVPSAFVFQLLKVYPVRTNDPVFAKTVTTDPLAYGVVPSKGAVPAVAPLGS